MPTEGRQGSHAVPDVPGRFGVCRPGPRHEGGGGGGEGGGGEDGESDSIELGRSRRVSAFGRPRRPADHHRPGRVRRTSGRIKATFPNLRIATLGLEVPSASMRSLQIGTEDRAQQELWVVTKNHEALWSALTTVTAICGAGPPGIRGFRTKLSRSCRGTHKVRTREPTLRPGGGSNPGSLWLPATPDHAAGGHCRR
ncbi:hypothetical protein F8M49_21290 [Rhodococcus zopfii]|uniref:Uncharacterized protein n=1 Tax=Rhodococcus zopfii TaxID=43772 RepID=A0ABU3WTD3_9NOCA|nr:hypothetical protein [Rhodococcus zopfii]